MSIEDKSGMRPKLGDTSITLPITFDYSGGRKDSFRSVKLWSVIIVLVTIVVDIGLLFSDRSFFYKILAIFLITLSVSLFIRYVLLNEKGKKHNYISMLEDDYKLNYQDIWGIYKVENTHPYICRFRNGKSGIYVRLNKDAILGKYADSEFSHYEAIADAYNLVGAGKVQMVYIDYMDNVGTDERLEDSFISLKDVSNPDLKDLLSDVYSYQQSNILGRVTTFDVYAFLWSGNDITAWNTITRILSCFLDANYRSYQILNDRDLRELSKTLFNLKEFSVTDACSQAFTNVGVSSITPISVTSADGNVVVINKTSVEKKADVDRITAERLAMEREISRRKKSKGVGERNDNDTFDDIF